MKALLCCLSALVALAAESDRLTLLRDAVGELVAELTPAPGSPPRDLKRQSWQTPGGTGPYGPGSPHTPSPAPNQQMMPMQQFMQPHQAMTMTPMTGPSQMVNYAPTQMMPVPSQMMPVANQMMPAQMMPVSTQMMTMPTQMMPVSPQMMPVPTQMMPMPTQMMPAVNQQPMVMGPAAFGQQQLQRASSPFMQYAPQSQNLRQQTTQSVPQQTPGNLRATNWIATPMQPPAGYFMGMSVPKKRALSEATNSSEVQGRLSLQEKRDIWDWFVNATLAAGTDDAQKAAVVDELFKEKLKRGAPRRKLIDLQELELAEQLKEVLRKGELTTKLPADYLEASKQYLDGLEDAERSRTMALLQTRAGDDDSFESFMKVNNVQEDGQAPALLLFRILKANRGRQTADEHISRERRMRDTSPPWPEVVTRGVGHSGAVSGSVGPANDLWERLEKRRNQD